MTRKYKIVLDTNVVHDNTRQDLSVLFRSDLADLYQFLNSTPRLSNVAIALPEMVINERIAQRMEQIEGSLVKIAESFIGLKSFEVQAPSEDYKTKDYKKMLQDKAYELATKYSIEILNAPNALQEKLIERALKKTRPFSKDKDDGFKDTIIWLTLLEDATKNRDTDYIFFTNDDDYDASEFLGIFGKEVKIVKTLAALKEYLDKELVLNLKLKATYEEIEILIKTHHIADIMMKINSDSKLLPDSLSFPTDSLRSLSTYNYYSLSLGSPSPAITIAYRFKNMTFRNITQRNEDIYDIDLEVSVVPIKKKENELGGIQLQLRYAIDLEVEPSINIFLKIEFHKNTGFIKIHNIEEAFLATALGYQ